VAKDKTIGAFGMSSKYSILLGALLGAVILVGGVTAAKANHQVQLQVFMIQAKEKGKSRTYNLPVTVLLQPVKRKRASDNVCRLSPRVRDGILGYFNGKSFTMIGRGKLDVADIAKKLKPVFSKSLGKYKGFVTDVSVQQGLPYVSGSAATMFNKQGCMTASHREEIERREQEKKEKAERQRAKKKK
jgi:hypothetical protein